MGSLFSGNGQGATHIEGGIFENSFVREGGAWRIAELHFYPQYEGDYPHGWSNAGGRQLPQVPYHFTIDESGIPIPRGHRHAASLPVHGPGRARGADRRAQCRGPGAQPAERLRLLCRPAHVG